MKIKFLLFLALTASLQSFAQAWVADSVHMGPGYGKDIYYSFNNDSIKAEDNNNWHIAFEMIPQGQKGNVGILANHARGAVTVYSLPLKASTSFATLSASDTITKNGPLLNADSSWHWGAFNQNRVISNLIDYGWGKYNMTTHMVDGDSLYLVYVGATPYKFTVNHYHSTPKDSIYYQFHIAKFDGTEDTTITVYRKYDGFESRNYAYYNATTRSFTNREPVDTAWDVVFTRYIEYVVAGPGPLMPYPVTGVLSNLGVEVAEVDGVDPDTAKYTSYVYKPQMQVIGSDWKTFNNTTFQWELDTNRTYFVKTDKTKEYYQVTFTGFAGGSLGKSVFEKRKVADYPVGISTIANEPSAHAIVPNPANNNADVMIDAKEAGNAQLIVSDMNGRVIYNAGISVKNGLNGFRINTSGFAAGTYIVNITNGTWKVTDKLLVQH
jgi:hypothetical protein